MTTRPRPQPLTFDGQEIKAKAGPVIVVVQRVLSDAFRLSIRHGGSGFEVPELSRSYPTEREARHAARVATALFRSGWTVQQVLDLVEVLNGA